MPAPRSYWAGVAHVLLRRTLHRIALVLVVLIALVAIFADFLASDLPLVLHFQGTTYWLPNVLRPVALQAWDNPSLMDAMKPGDWALLPICPWGFNHHDFASVLAPPTEFHWLGTDPSGRDVLARVIHGTRVSLVVGVLSVSVSVSIGVVLGSVAGYYRGIVDSLVARIIEIVNPLPTILILLTALAIINPQGWGTVVWMMLVIGLVSWTTVARLIRGEILKVTKLDYVQASRAQGAGSLRIIAYHVIPNSISPVLVAATFLMASAILIEGALSFLGFGIPPDMASWGGLLGEVRGNVQAWWLAVFPGFAIFLTVTIYNVLGEGLRDAIDPRLR